MASHYSDETPARNKLREKRLILVYSFTSPFALFREKKVMADHLSFAEGVYLGVRSHHCGQEADGANRT